MSKKNIVILVPVVWSYRNFVLGGVYHKLVTRYNIYLAIPEVAYASFVKLGINPDKLIVVKQPLQSYLYKWILRILKKSHLRIFPMNTGGIFELFHQIDSSFSFKNMVLYEVPARFFANNILFKLLEKLERHLFYKANSKFLNPVILPLKLHFVLSTANVVEWEWPFFRVAQTLGIKTIAHILSFDNITSRGYLPIGLFDHYLVWNEHMGAELSKYYNIHSSKITITGTPQFDFHIKLEYLLTREQTLEKLGFKKDIKYILYCANHFNISPNEPALLEDIITGIRSSAQFSDFQFVVRLHPMDNYQRWDDLLQKLDGIKLSIPWAHNETLAIYWGEPTLEDLISFSNTLRYAAVMLNIASTVSIDAAITNTPTICVGYHPSVTTEGTFYHDVHYSEHYKPIMDTGATPLAKSHKELLQLIQEQIYNRSAFDKERSLLVKKYLPVDKKIASDRIIEFLNNA